jgi:hypothetical protein
VANTLVVWAIKTMLWVMFGLAMLSNLGIDVSTFIASLGIGGIAIALAVQNILGDLFASLSIAVDKPFEVGDAISVAGFSGTVEHVGLKTTRVRADSGEQIVIANAELLKNTVRNFKRMSNRRVQFSLMADPATPPACGAQGAGRAARNHRASARRALRPRAFEAGSAGCARVRTGVFRARRGVWQVHGYAAGDLPEAMEAFAALGVSHGGPSQHVVLERRKRKDDSQDYKAQAGAGLQPVGASLQRAR